MKSPCVYIIANKRNGTLYCGVTSDLAKRAYELRTDVMQPSLRAKRSNPAVARSS
jgi:putative endonuclease